MKCVRCGKENPAEIHTCTPENPSINALDFGIPAEFAERAENYARWAIAAEREACAKHFDGSDTFIYRSEVAAAIRARSNT